MSNKEGLSILVTGGTGSFGQAFVSRMLQREDVKRVVVFSRDELKQFEMAERISSPKLRYFIGDIRDLSRLTRALDGIDTVIHAAALKQVVAAEYNPIECIKTNVLGGENVINACIDSGVRNVIALSTDKAVNPINLYGATKLCSDKLFVAANHLAQRGGTRFSIVRYGNVLGSRGSVIPVFRQKRESGVLPITDPRMTRFWITLDDGVRFVERCLGMMRGGEIFVPKIVSMKITELAAAIAPECRLEVVGIRPGEKLHEVLIPVDEARFTREYESFFVVQPSSPMWDFDTTMQYGGETGQAVGDDFEYVSDRNTRWVDVEAMREMLE